ncbi:MAG: magnesium transporter CorA family protein [Hyphomicrobiaceae bacterium]|nr:magnesium transporter CorA family protein [Hyphomicrobiaceae bacterium]
MLHTYASVGGCLVQRAGIDSRPEITDTTLWVDLVDPTPAEDAVVETALGISIPTRAEAREIEASSRLYRENGAVYMTAFVLYNADAEVPDGATVTFVLTARHLVTIRYHEPRAFPLFATRAAKGEVECTSAPMVLIGLIETIVERAADIIERTQDAVETTARRIFTANRESRNYARRLDEVLRAVGRQGDITARLEESAFSLERVLSYLLAALRERGESASTLARLDTAQRDVRSLAEQMRFLMDRITFLLDATLGAISIEQNRTMKVFSLVAATLMPPTLIAAIYGMNFKHMPELEWLSGYPMALGLMVVAALLPFLYFRRKGWL